MDDGGGMNNDPVGNIMPRNDFSLTIIWLVWIAAAVATLHLMAWRESGEQGEKEARQLKSIRQEFRGFMVFVNVESNLFFSE